MSSSFIGAPTVPLPVGAPTGITCGTRHHIHTATTQYMHVQADVHQMYTILASTLHVYMYMHVGAPTGTCDVHVSTRHVGTGWTPRSGMTDPAHLLVHLENLRWHRTRTLGTVLCQQQRSVHGRL